MRRHIIDIRRGYVNGDPHKIVYRAYCGCGWSAPESHTMAGAAGHDGDEHEITMARIEG